MCGYLFSDVTIYGVPEDWTFIFGLLPIETPLYSCVIEANCLRNRKCPMLESFGTYLVRVALPQMQYVCVFVRVNNAVKHIQGFTCWHWLMHVCVIEVLKISLIVVSSHVQALPLSTVWPPVSGSQQRDAAHPEQAQRACAVRRAAGAWRRAGTTSDWQCL